MTVRDLIAELQKFEPSLEAYYDDGENGSMRVEAIRQERYLGIGPYIVVVGDGDSG